MGNIGDGDKQPPAVAFFLAVDGIVKIARVGAIDGDEVDISQVVATFLGAARHARAEFLDLFQHVGRPVMRDGVRVNRNIGCYALVSRRAEDTDNAACCLLYPRRIVHDFCNDHLAGLRPTEARPGYEHTMGNPRVVGNDNTDSAFFYELARNLLRPALKDFNEFAFGTAAPVQSCNSHGDAITVKKRPHLPSRKKDVFGFRVISHDKSEAVPVPADDTRHEIELRGQAVLSTPIFDNLAFADHGMEAIYEQRAHALAPELERFENRVHL